MAYATINSNYVLQRLAQAEEKGVKINLIEIVVSDSEMLLM